MFGVTALVGAVLSTTRLGPLAVAQARGQVPTPVRQMKCCQAVPDWVTPASLTCTCTRDTKIQLHKDDIPGSVQRIAISNMGDVEIHTGAIFALSSLTSLTIGRSKSVRVVGDGLALSEDSRLKLLEMSTIDTVKMNGNSLSGHWGAASTIKFRNISSLTFSENAFSHESTSKGPVVEIADIGEFSSNGAFSGPVAMLTLKEVRDALTCSPKTFGERIRHLKLERVRISEVERECFAGGGHSALVSLSIQSCALTNIRLLAILGEIERLDVENSYIGSIAESAFNVTVSSASITDSTVAHLARSGLQIWARHSISISGLWVNRLERGALKELRAAGGDSATAALRLSRLRVAHVDPGSLQLHPSVEPCVSALEVGNERPRPCPAESMVRRLVDSDPHRPLSAAEQLVLRQLQRPDSCPADQPGPAGSDCEGVRSAVSGVAAAAAALALLSLALVVVIALLVAGRRRPFGGKTLRSAVGTKKRGLGTAAAGAVNGGAGSAASSLCHDTTVEFGYSSVQCRPTAAVGVPASAGDWDPYSEVTPCVSTGGRDLYSEVTLPLSERKRQRSGTQSPSIEDQPSAPPVPPITLERLRPLTDATHRSPVVD
ncbi:uncharacterized protein LOC122373728 [Amphibalanus amphitrite]|uniref:uncharacterized protein LOC122373728 n=1 Tax=Amphibalanus amphitrite TaxID=1232801 RepID=UPI001C90A69C|nr:uncharacterized protein LOC122373728 [Amphibalanus amphitrite]